MTDKAPRALLGLDDLARLPTAKVLVVTGDQSRIGIQKELPSTAVVTWMGGVNGTDWSPLAGRKVDLWLDRGAGRKYSAQITAKLLSIGSGPIRIAEHFDDADLDPAHGAHDAVRGKWSKEQIKEHLSQYWKEVDPANPPEIPKGPIGIVTTTPSGSVEPEPVPPPAVGGEPMAAKWARWGIPNNGGSAPSNASNIYKALRGLNTDQTLGLSYDEFLKQIVWSYKGAVRPFIENDIVVLQCEIQDGCGLVKAAHEDIKRCTMRVARETIVNEARDWLKSLSWDAIERLPSLMSDGFGAERNAYTEAVGRCFFMSMAQRILQPGCKQDYVLVFEGSQGERKTSALEIIGGKWFSEIHEDFGSLEFLIAIQGKVLVGIGELSAFKGARLERVKGIITRRIDTFRSKWGVWANDHARVACFVGDTNESNYLNDPTGGRRYWPIAAPDISLDYLRSNRDQLWAEARVRCEKGECYWDVPEGAAKEAQDARREILPWEEKLIPWLYERTVTELTIAECLTFLGIAPRDETTAAKVVAPILRRAGWKRVQKWIGEQRRVYVYRNLAAPEQAPLAGVERQGAVLQ